ncbi:putative ribonuclease H-like domain-containing protein [Tanacetum coccineum]|uniref:Ribonuclease H-like domain-containing protein n=1 Tax=Tanacetum coccineum TaxID=301880 RepID=A0ABQ4WZM1_9ASTR
MNQFYEMKGIKREFSVARTPQQNRVAKRKNITLIEPARTMLADSKLPTTFWAEAVNIACYVQNRVLVIKPHNKISYVLFLDRKPTLSFMRPFGCPVTILNTLDHLEENLHITFLENKPIVARTGPEWIFDIDTLTKSMNYKLVVSGNQTNGNAVQRILLMLDSNHQGKNKRRMLKIKRMKIVNSTVNTASIMDNAVDENTVYRCADDLNIPKLEEIVYSEDDEGVGAEADMNNLGTFMPVSPIPTTRIHKDHPFEQIIRDLHSTLQI